MPAPHNMVDPWLEGNLNGVVVLVRIPTPVREAGKELLMRLNGGRGGWLLKYKAEKEGSIKNEG